MYKVCCVIAGLALFLPLWALAQAGSESGRLAAMRDKSRPVLVFCPSSGARQVDSAVREQRALFAGHEAELKDRDVVLMFVPATDPELTSAGEWEALRRQFHAEDTRFMVVLLGKDGDEKFRSNEPVTIEKLNALIDAMPMRQQEMRDGHHAE